MTSPGSAVNLPCPFIIFAGRHARFDNVVAFPQFSVESIRSRKLDLKNRMVGSLDFLFQAPRGAVWQD